MMRRVVLVLAGLFLLALGGAAWWMNDWLQRPKSLDVRGFSVDPGMSESAVVLRLVQQGVVDHPFWFRLYIRLRGESGRLQAGVYDFHGDFSPRSVLEKLRRGVVVQPMITVPEGLRSPEIIDLLARRTGVAAARWQNAWKRLGIGEGELLPESWRYTRPVDPYALLQRMRHAQEYLLRGLEPERGRWQQLRIIASIIEKETALDRERPLISAVIYNRLKRKMPLQMDPTVIYGIYQRDGAFSGNLTRADLRADTPWNTYRHKGLPPTPICHPGRASLLAAARPADSDALYFVADGTGGHQFSETLEEHRRNVARMLREQRARAAP